MTHSLGYIYANRMRYDGWNRPRSEDRLAVHVDNCD